MAGFDRLLLNAVERADAGRVSMLLAAGANANAVRGNGRSALAGACLVGSEACVRLLLGAGADLRFARDHLRTVLVRGLRAGAGSEAAVAALAALRQVLSVREPVMVFDAGEVRELVEALVRVRSDAVMVGDGEFVVVLEALRVIQGDPVRRVPNLLHVAATAGNPVVVRALVSEGWSPLEEFRGAALGYGTTVGVSSHWVSRPVTAFEAFFFGGNSWQPFAVEALRELFRWGRLGDDDARRLVSSFFMWPNAIALPVVLGEFRDRPHVFPVDSMASFWNAGADLLDVHVEALEFFLGAGLDPNAVSSARASRLADELGWVVASPGSSTARVRRALRALRLLVLAGGRPREVVDAFSERCLLFHSLARVFVNSGARKGFGLVDDVLSMAKLLVESGFDVNEVDGRGNTALHAILSGRVLDEVGYRFEDFVRGLVGLGFDLGRVNGEGFSVMQLARLAGSRGRRAASALVACGAPKRVSRKPTLPAAVVEAKALGMKVEGVRRVNSPQVVSGGEGDAVVRTAVVWGAGGNGKGLSEQVSLFG